jgi:hypothetical protein
MPSKLDKFAALREARAKGGRLSQWKVSPASLDSIRAIGALRWHAQPEDAELYDEVTDDQYRSIVGSRLERDDFIIDDDGRARMKMILKERMRSFDEVGMVSWLIRTIAWLAHELSAEAQASQSEGQSQRRKESRCYQIQTQGFVFRLRPSRGVDLDIDVPARSIGYPGGRLYGRADVLCNRDVDFGRAWPEAKVVARHPKLGGHGA